MSNTITEEIKKCEDCGKECPPLPEWIIWSAYLVGDLLGYNKKWLCRKCFSGLVKAKGNIRKTAKKEDVK